MDQKAFVDATRVTSSWAELTKDFDCAERNAACYRVGYAAPTDTPGTSNQNTRAAVQYLAGFLEQQGVKIR